MCNGFVLGCEEGKVVRDLLVFPLAFLGPKHGLGSHRVVRSLAHRLLLGIGPGPLLDDLANFGGFFDADGVLPDAVDGRGTLSLEHLCKLRSHDCSLTGHQHVFPVSVLFLLFLMRKSYEVKQLCVLQALRISCKRNT